MAELNGQVTDLEGNVIQVGDRIAGAFRIGNVAVLRTGRVLAFSERGNKLTVRVQWEKDSSALKSDSVIDIVGNIEADLNRFVKIKG